MFGGAGAPALEEDEDPEKEKQIEQAAKAMGFSVNEYKLVLRMQENLANAVNSLRCTGGNEAKGVTITMDGNSPPKFLKVKITDDGKKLPKADLEKEITTALKDASAQAKKENQAAIMRMNQEVAAEMKKMGMA